MVLFFVWGALMGFLTGRGVTENKEFKKCIVTEEQSVCQDKYPHQTGKK